ncbi:SDR family NAD(P)-dependent oxidoreductase [Shinella zoogloeoides]|jgi:NAD(P)-dependent dehydrogenase (short-subunit alcohol dehydrogenase family)|uniref:SDR family NAD(P)-dependent oxidoreductase n=1 Tax=Shinella zoogloeoides TaxID=352475 RepID=UPI00273E1F02|nr:SDR family NAD(P)-dependent oxidoreductase [Shinella zoogloeoides]WLR93241.1 SDR family NAD(P)-dependent oxidoreductase [Shinella zoogloeoides]
MTASQRTALVTGASRGIGAAIAVGLARRGYDVALNDIARQKDTLSGVAAEIEALGRRAVTVLADVSDRAAVETMAKAAIEAFGHIDVVVNNAGILIAGDVDGLKEEYWDSVMDVNAKGTFLVIQSLLPIMKARRYGRIVNIASIGGKHGAPSQAHYSASKAAVMGFTRVLAQEVGVDGITANCVCPGIILTAMGRVNLDDPEIRKSWQDKTAMRRIGDPEDVVGAVAFFASDDAAFVTGQTLNVDGGIVFS